MRTICFGMHKLLNQFRISIWAPRFQFEVAVNSFCAPKQFLLILLDSCPDQSNECDHQFETEREARERKVDHCYVRTCNFHGLCAGLAGPNASRSKAETSPCFAADLRP